MKKVTIADGLVTKKKVTKKATRTAKKTSNSSAREIQLSRQDKLEQLGMFIKEIKQTFNVIKGSIPRIKEAYDTYVSEP